MEVTSVSGGCDLAAKSLIMVMNVSVANVSGSNPGAKLQAASVH